MHADMKRMYHHALWFPCDVAIDESASEDDVYRLCAAPLVRAATAPRGGVATLFCYGQTGSGKTHTMGNIEARAARALFPADGGAASHSVVLRYFELVGKQCVDLIAPASAEPLALVCQGESVRVTGGVEVVVRSAEHLLELLARGRRRRATAATDVNGGSSRSHAVCQITISAALPTDTDAGLGSGAAEDGAIDDARGTGVLTLVDCAGSERKEDSMYHSKERQRESAEINASLYALKECVRARAAIASGARHVKVPYRSSTLTKVLMESFVRRDARLAVVAAVSPIPTDTEHSAATLKTVCALAGRAPGGGGPPVPFEDSEEVKPQERRPRAAAMHPRRWSAEQLQQWVSRVGGGKFGACAERLPGGLTGAQFTRWGRAQFTQLCGADPAVGEALWVALQNELKRVADAAAAHRDDLLGIIDED